MVRARLLAVIGMALMITGMFVHQPIYAAHGTSDCDLFDAEYGDNTEENACNRWQCNQARHWRYVVTHR